MMRSNEELIRAVRDGDSAAFTDLVRRYERAAWATAWKVLRDHHAALDATQNAFVEAYRQLAQLRAPSQFGVWLLRITHREALRIVRRCVRELPLEAARHVVAPDAAEGQSADFDELIAAVGSLPDHERLVVALRYFNGHSVEEVAQLTGRPVGTVTKQLSRAIARLKSTLRSSIHES